MSKDDRIKESMHDPITGVNLSVLTVMSLDTNDTVVAQFNPKELQIDKQVPWSKVNQANQSNEKGIHLEFTGAEGRSMSIELLFDKFEENASVMPDIEKLERFASVWEESKDENKRRPHRCVVTWGEMLGSQGFRCVIESLSTKYTMFSPSGVPLRATCTVKLKEADVVSMAKGGGSGGGSSGGGSR
jgi:hypothetical protein